LKQQKHTHEANKTSTARRGGEKIRQFNNLNKQDNRGAPEKDSSISKCTITKKLVSLAREERRKKTYQTRRTISSSQMNAAEIAKKLQNTVEVAKGSNPPRPPPPPQKNPKKSLRSSLLNPQMLPLLPRLSRKTKRGKKTGTRQRKLRTTKNRHKTCDQIVLKAQI
jgi:hypothetical protein